MKISKENTYYVLIVFLFLLSGMAINRWLYYSATSSKFNSEIQRLRTNSNQINQDLYKHDSLWQLSIHKKLTEFNETMDLIDEVPKIDKNNLFLYIPNISCLSCNEKVLLIIMEYIIQHQMDICVLTEIEESNKRRIISRDVLSGEKMYLLPKSLRNNFLPISKLEKPYLFYMLDNRVANIKVLDKGGIKSIDFFLSKYSDIKCSTKNLSL